MKNKVLPLLVISPLLIAIVGGIIFFNSCGSKKQKDTTEANSDDGYAGSESCKECHAKFYELWATSHHGLAMQPVTKEFTEKAVPDQLKPQPVEGNTFTIEKQEGELWFIEKTKNGETKKYQAVHALGGKNIYYLLTPFPNGKLQVLPLAYDLNRKEWYNTSKSAVRHFVDIEDEAIPWKHFMYTFNTTCHDCHVSQLTSNYDLATKTYFTTWKEPGINCEACHGPSEEHIIVCREAAKEGKVPEDLKIIITGDFTADQHNATCATCHAKMNVLDKKFIPGDRFYDHYDLITLENPDYYPDGRDLGENYTYTSWSQSPCVQNSDEFHCVSCHTSSGRFRFADNPNQSCMPCHAEKVNNPTEHTHHEAGSKGSECNSCHMPKTEFARMIRSDHSMRPPMPSATIKFKSPNACNICHEDETPEWADKHVRQWRKRDYQKETLYIGQLILEARQNQWDRLDEMLDYIEEHQNDEEVFATSLIRMIRNSSNKKIWPVLEKLIETSQSPLVRGAAVNVLGMNINEKSAAAMLRALDDSIFLVRYHASAVLAAFPQSMFSQEDYNNKVHPALLNYKNSLVIHEDNWASHYNLGNFYSQQGDMQAAARSFDISSEINPEALAPIINSAFNYSIMRNVEMAEKKFNQALNLEPENEVANLNYALFLGEMGRMEEARITFLKVMQINPKSVVAAYNLSVILSQNKELEDAISYAKIAMDNAGEQPKYGYTYAYFLSQAKREKEAEKVLLNLIEKHPSHIDSYLMLGSQYENNNQKGNAIKLYKKALKQNNINTQQKMMLENKIRFLSME